MAPYSSLQTPPSQESILQGTVVTLRQQHAKVVIIRAGDPLDMIFLSRYLRQNYPQARLVTVGADLLMVHDFYDPRFHGILAVTTYPILTGVRFPALVTGRRTAGNTTFIPGQLFGRRLQCVSVIACASPGTRPQPTARGRIRAVWTSFLSPVRRRLMARTSVADYRGNGQLWPVKVLDDEFTPDPEKTKTGTNNPEPTVRPVDLQNNTDNPRLIQCISRLVGQFSGYSGVPTVFLSFLLLFPNAFIRSEILGRFGGNPLVPRNRLLFTGSMLLLTAQTLFVLPAVIWLGNVEKSEMGELWFVLICYVITVGLLGVACYEGFKNANPLCLGGAEARRAWPSLW